jgi:hypothetical protein
MLRKKNIVINNYDIILNLDNFHKQFIKAYRSNINPEKYNGKNNITGIIKEFDTKYNNGTILSHQISIMSKKYSVKIKGIIVHFITNENEQNLVAAILHSINTFVNLYQYEYDGLTIYVCTDDNKRTNSLFTISGITDTSKNIIILTKKEEIIKLLFHELCHYAKLDDTLRKNFIVEWSVSDNDINMSEAYSEMLSIILTCAYISAHISTSIENTYNLFIKFIQAEISHSLYLCLNYLSHINTNVEDFFSGKGPIMNFNIQVPAYVFLRTCLLLKLNKLNNLLLNKVSDTDSVMIFNMIDVNQLKKELLNYDGFKTDSSMSYMYIDYIYV